MLRLPIGLLAALLSMLALPAAAQDTETAAYVEFHKALALDDRCGFLRNFERDGVYDVETELLKPLSFFAFHQAGKISDDEYWAERETLVAEGRAAAETIACTDTVTAAALIVPLRDRLARQLYAELMIVMQAKTLTQEQENAARAYEAMIAPLYGENWPGFVGNAQRLVQQKLDEAGYADVDPFGLGGLGGMGGYVGTGLDELYDSWGYGNYQYENLLLDAAELTDDILFEAIAEQFGYRYRTLYATDSGGYIRTLTDFAGNRVADLWSAPARYKVLLGETEVNLAFATLSDGSLRAMSFGADAAALEQGSITLWINPDKLTDEQLASYSYPFSEQWRSQAVTFTGRRIDEPCLGGPCFALPPDAMDAIMSGARDQSFRFYIATVPDPIEPAPNEAGIHTGFTVALWRREDFLAQQP